MSAIRTLFNFHKETQVLRRQLLFCKNLKVVIGRKNVYGISASDKKCKKCLQIMSEQQLISLKEQIRGLNGVNKCNQVTLQNGPGEFEKKFLGTILSWKQVALQFTQFVTNNGNIISRSMRDCISDLISGKSKETIKLMARIVQYQTNKIKFLKEFNKHIQWTKKDLPNLFIMNANKKGVIEKGSLMDKEVSVVELLRGIITNKVASLQNTIRQNSFSSVYLQKRKYHRKMINYYFKDMSKENCDQDCITHTVQVDGIKPAQVVELKKCQPEMNTNKDAIDDQYNCNDSFLKLNLVRAERTKRSSNTNLDYMKNLIISNGSLLNNNTYDNQPWTEDTISSPDDNQNNISFPLPPIIERPTENLNTCKNEIVMDIAIDKQDQFTVLEDTSTNSTEYSNCERKQFEEAIVKNVMDGTIISTETKPVLKSGEVVDGINSSPVEAVDSILQDDLHLTIDLELCNTKASAGMDKLSNLTTNECSSVSEEESALDAHSSLINHNSSGSPSQHVKPTTQRKYKYNFLCPEIKDHTKMNGIELKAQCMPNLLFHKDMFKLSPLLDKSINNISFMDLESRQIDNSNKSVNYENKRSAPKINVNGRPSQYTAIKNLLEKPDEKRILLVKKEFDKIKKTMTNERKFLFYSPTKLNSVPNLGKDNDVDLSVKNREMNAHYLSFTEKNDNWKKGVAPLDLTDHSATITTNNLEQDTQNITNNISERSLDTRHYDTGIKSKQKEKELQDVGNRIIMEDEEFLENNRESYSSVGNVKKNLFQVFFDRITEESARQYGNYGQESPTISQFKNWQPS